MAETWITIDDNSVRESLADGELTDFTTAGLSPGAPVLAGCIRRVVNRVRGDVAASGRYTIGPDGTVPPEMESATLHLLRREIATRVPRSGIVFDDLRKDGLRDAEAQLASVREGKAGITAPETVSTAAPAPDTGGWGGQEIINFSGGRGAVTDADF